MSVHCMDGGDWRKKSMIELIRALQTIKDLCIKQKNCNNCPICNENGWCLIMDGEDGICPRDWPVDEIIFRGGRR